MPESSKKSLDIARFSELVSLVTFDFRILGPLEVEGDSGPLALGGQRQRAVLAVLLLHAGRVVPTDRLIHEIWGDHPPTSAANALQNAVSQLRKVLGPETLQTRAPGYVLVVENSRIDAGRFESALADARRAAPAERARLLRQALDTWRGPPLAEFTFASFAQNEIHRLEELRLVATEQRIEADIESGQPGDVVPELHGLVAEHPLRETYWRLLMLALYRAGRQAEALDAYQSARVRLVDELGIEPSEELRRLHGSDSAPGRGPERTRKRSRVRRRRGDSQGPSGRVGRPGHRARWRR